MERVEEVIRQSIDVLSRLRRAPFVFEVRDLWLESPIDTGVLKNKTVIQMAYWFEKFISRQYS